MLETNEHVDHLAGIIPIAGQPLEFNMPWHDCLMPVNSDYHAIERAVHTAAAAGCNTIWVVMYRETQPIIKKKLGEWIYDPLTVWKKPWPVLQIKPIPIYYVGIAPRDRYRRDSLGWSSIYGAKVASRVCKKISKWVVPKRFLVVWPYGIAPEDQIIDSRKILRGKQNVVFSSNKQTFKDSAFTPFTFSQEEYEECRIYFRDRYSGRETMREIKDIFKPVELDNYINIDLKWYHDISNWTGYKGFISSEHNSLCERPKYMVSHKWRGLMDDK